MATGRAILLEHNAQPDQARLSWRGEMLTVFFSAWALAGAFLDGWAHSRVIQFETFFTPWHAVFYTGFFAMAAWVIWTVRANRVAGYRARPQCLPDTNSRSQDC